jgi:hypothetical protein
MRAFRMSVLIAYFGSVLPLLALTGCDQLNLGGSGSEEDGEEKDDEKAEDDDKDKKKKKKKKKSDDDEDEDEDEDDKKKKKKKKKASKDSIGIEECDEYIEKMEECLEDIPAAGKPAMEQALEQSRDAFTQSAEAAKDSKVAEDALRDSCKQSLEALEKNPACK